MVDIEVGAVGSGLSSRMSVEPDKLVQLKQGIEAERDRIADWLIANRRRLEKIESPSEDPSTKDTMFLLSQNAQSAIAAANSYVDRLNDVAHKLHESAVTYGLIEDDNVNRFQQGQA